MQPKTHFSCFLLFTLLSAFLSACSSTGVEYEEPIGQDNAPLSSFEAIFSGAPQNDSLPNDMKADTDYPKLYTDLLAYQSPVKSQGKRGVCSIFATTALMEHLYIKAGHSIPDFSEQYLQWSVKFQLGHFPYTSGSNSSSNLKAINQYGIPRENAWPYEAYPWNESNDSRCVGESQPTICYTNGEPPESARLAEKYTLPTGQYLNTRSIKNHIYTKKTGVVVGLDFFYQSWNHRKSALPTNGAYWNKGYVLYPNGEDIEESHKQRAGHAVLIVGWDDNLEVPRVDAQGKALLDDNGDPIKEKGFYIFKNSWGTAGFGIDNPYGAGYGYLSMQYVHTFGSANISDLPSSPTTGNHKERTFTGSVVKNGQAFHTLNLGAGAHDILIEMTGNNDGDLYTRFGTRPSLSKYDCRPYQSGSTETCKHSTAQGEILEIMVVGWGEGKTDYTIKASWRE